MGRRQVQTLELQRLEDMLALDQAASEGHVALVIVAQQIRVLAVGSIEEIQQPGRAIAGALSGNPQALDDAIQLRAHIVAHRE